ncbi:MAG: hypothetical protein IKS54_03780 [Erysipelotrichaceae bacterium]|nr:hypothetical protein [Erysipelotrichaceae bacterium]
MKTQKKRYAITLIGVLSLAHACIDFLCAFSLYRSFISHSNAFLIYNFCAFALQMPIGILIDMYNSKRKESYFISAFTTVLGIVLTVTGCFISEIITGLGNAFFHAGGGVLTIYEDRNNQLKGKGLGVFVAPGAIGLILGILYHDTSFYYPIIAVISIILLFVIVSLYRMRKEERLDIEISLPDQAFIKIMICFVVVVLRSLAGMAIVFPWKNDHLSILISVFALALGKSAGGFLFSQYDMKKIIVATLGISALAYLIGHEMGAGLLALFFFNMTMPLTLYLLSEELKGTPGFAFGILTFGLFLGYLPVLYGAFVQASPIFGTFASIVSMIFLLYFVKIGNYG